MSKTQQQTELHKAVLIEKKVFYLKDLPTISAYLDAGMSAKKLRGMLYNMYKNKVKNVNQAKFCVCLMQQVKEGEYTQTLKFSQNWNNKLACPFYTTIRLDQPKYKVGTVFRVVKV